MKLPIDREEIFRDLLGSFDFEPLSNVLQAWSSPIVMPSTGRASILKDCWLAAGSHRPKERQIGRRLYNSVHNSQRKRLTIEPCVST